MLRLVHPQREGQDPPSARRKGRRATALNLTLDEVQCVRAALRNLARAHGSWGYLAMVMGVPVKSLYQVAAPKGKRPSVAMVLLAARAGGTTVEQNPLRQDRARGPLPHMRPLAGTTGDAR
jgi:hypothetical protein